MSARGLALLSVRDISVCLGAARHVAVDGLSFELRAGERAALLGPSGCGKTTCLRAIAGFERLDRGSISLRNTLLSERRTHVPPHRRGMGMVFQDYALFPHLSVNENVAFGLAHLSEVERQRCIAKVIDLVGLAGLEARTPAQLSGGQQQRAALARALAPEPQLLLLDEPFSGLDANLRTATRQFTEGVLDSVGATALLVTHDQAEAMSFAERLMVLRAGRVEQEGSPEQLYRAPKNAFVARFLGAANLIPGEATGDQASTALGKIALQHPAQGRVLLCVRPEAIHVSAPASEPRAQITFREYQGAVVLYRLRGEDFEVSAAEPGDSAFVVGDIVSLSVTSSAATLQGPDDTALGPTPEAQRGYAALDVPHAARDL